MRLIDADALKKEFTEGAFTTKGVREIIDNAPTVERPKGKWIVDGHHYICSNCGKTLALMFSECDDDLIGCPFCLADMRGDKE